MRVGVVWTFLLSSVFSFLFFLLWETARYRLKYCLKELLNPKQPTNQIPIQESKEKLTKVVPLLKLWQKKGRFYHIRVVSFSDICIFLKICLLQQSVRSGYALVRIAQNVKIHGYTCRGSNSATFCMPSQRSQLIKEKICSCRDLIISLGVDPLFEGFGCPGKQEVVN